MFSVGGVPLEKYRILLSHFEKYMTSDGSTRVEEARAWTGKWSSIARSARWAYYRTTNFITLI